MKSSNLVAEVRMLGITEVDETRCSHLMKVMHTIRDENIPGDLIETGIYKGGTSIIMGWANKEYNLNKTQYAFDSFKGCPDPAETRLGKHPQELHSKGDFTCDIDTVYDTFKKFDLQDDIIMVEGWFEDTCPKYAKVIDEIALLRFDGDLYSSTLEVLNAFYPKVVKGGFIIIDDYCIEACRIAVHEYLDKHNLQPNIQKPAGGDACGSWWRKE